MKQNLVNQPVEEPSKAVTKCLTVKTEKVQEVCDDDKRKTYLGGLIVISNESDYFDAVQWDTGRYGTSQQSLIKWRIGLLAPLWAM